MKSKIIEVSSDSNIGGAGKCLITLLKNFDYTKFDVKVILPPDSLLKPEIEALGIEVIEVMGIAEKSLDLKSVKSLKEIFKREKPDLVHTHASMSARIAAKHSGAKVVYTRHSVFPQSKRLTTFPGKQINGFINNFYSHSIIAVAEAAKDNLTDTGVKDSKISVILNGVDGLKPADDFEKLEIRERFGVKKGEKVMSIVINDDRVMDVDVVVLAIGHSARDTFEMINNVGIKMESKAFAVGIRIQHPQEIININQYGDKYYKRMNPASYKLTYKASNGRGVYSFCMCPGGYVVNASSEDGMLAINGMSYYKRDSVNANSAIVVTVTPDDFGNGVLDGVRFQRDLEEKAYKLGNGNIPIQRLGDYYNNVESTRLGNIEPIFKGNYELSNLNLLYPGYINESLKEAIEHFGYKINGFNDVDSIIAGVESRTSSPVKIIRNEEYVSNIEGIYPCGEGCGYAGGITTSAIDGMKVAEAIISKYRMI